MKEWITGRNPIYEALQARRRHFFRLLVAKGIEEKGRVSEIIRTMRGFRLPIEMADRRHLDSLGENHQGLALEASSYPYADMKDIFDLAKKREEHLFVLLLDVLQNPQNLGTLIRTAEAVGVHGVIIPPNRAAGVTPSVVTASAGAAEHMLVAQGNLAQAMQAIKDANGWIIGLEGSPEALPAEQLRLDGALGLVVGSEGEGMRALVRKNCDQLLKLPMVGKVESLNAAVAGSIVLYLAYQARAVKR
jgi:23S rRNA (guanosine2251-2'-O)-methyltransferase